MPAALCALVVPGKGAVGIQRALLAVAPQSQPQIGELNALRLQSLPVDTALIVGHVHAPARGIARAGVADAFAVTDELVLLHTADGDALQRRVPHHACAVVDVDLSLVGSGSGSGTFTGRRDMTTAAKSPATSTAAHSSRSTGVRLRRRVRRGIRVSVMAASPS